jgi:DNA-binding response OmpR family regulator
MSHKPSVVVVDDDDDLREVLAELLEAEGYDVHTAPDGGEALNLLVDLEEPPALVLLDWRMPEMSGRELLGALRSERTWSRTLVAIVSGAKPEGISGAEYLPKPLNPEDVLALARRAVEQRAR